MASGIIGNDVPRKGLRVRVPCPPLSCTRSGTTLRYCVASPQTVEALESTKPLAKTQREPNGQMQTRTGTAFRFVAKCFHCMGASLAGNFDSIPACEDPTPCMAFFISGYGSLLATIY
jgi:hypothetical protein